MAGLTFKSQLEHLYSSNSNDADEAFLYNYKERMRRFAHQEFIGIGNPTLEINLVSNIPYLWSIDSTARIVEKKEISSPLKMVRFLKISGYPYRTLKKFRIENLEFYLFCSGILMSDFSILFGRFIDKSTANVYFLFNSDIFIIKKLAPFKSLYLKILIETSYEVKVINNSPKLIKELPLVANYNEFNQLMQHKQKNASISTIFNYFLESELADTLDDIPF
jgi:hypothetical protein